MPPSTRTTVIVLTVLAMLLVLGPAAWMVQLHRTAVEVEATVIAQKRHTTSQSDTCHPTIEYTVEGERYEHYFDWSKACCEVGDPMTVWVERDDPTRPFGSQSTKGVPIGLMLLGAVIGMLAIRKIHHQRKHGPFVGEAAEVKPVGTSWLLTGRARHGELLEAPIRGEPCIAWHVVVVAMNESPKPGEPGRLELLDVAGSRPFDLEDDSGTIHVDAGRGTVVRLEKRHPERESMDPPAGLATPLTERGLAHHLERSYRWYWRVETLGDGERVQVCGHCIERGDGRLAIAKRDDGPMCISNEHAPLA